MATDRITLHCEVSNDVTPEAHMNDRLAGQFEALAFHWAVGSDGHRYLLKLAEVHRARAEQAMRKVPKKKRAGKV